MWSRGLVGSARAFGPAGQIMRMCARSPALRRNGAGDNNTYTYEGSGSWPSTYIEAVRVGRTTDYLQNPMIAAARRNETRLYEESINHSCLGFIENKYVP